MGQVVFANITKFIAPHIYNNLSIAVTVNDSWFSIFVRAGKFKGIVCSSIYTLRTCLEVEITIFCIHKQGSRVNVTISWISALDVAERDCGGRSWRITNLWPICSTVLPQDTVGNDRGRTNCPTLMQRQLCRCRRKSVRTGKRHPLHLSGNHAGQRESRPYHPGARPCQSALRTHTRTEFLLNTACFCSVLSGLGDFLKRICYYANL